MRNAKLWSVLLAAALLCACIVGIMFTGASATDTRLPNATATYVVGTDGENIRACLEKAAEENWAAESVLEICFSGEDSSAYAAPNPQEGISGYTLFEVTTIFREDNTKLPIIIRGTDEGRAAMIKTAWNDYCATNDYYFTNLTMQGGLQGKPVKFYAGSGKMVFEETNHLNYLYTYYFGDNNSMDAYEGWDAEKVAANANEKGLIETGIIFGHGCSDFYEYIPSGVDDTQRLSAVGYDGNESCNTVLVSLKRANADVKVALTEEEVEAIKEAAASATFKPGNVVTDSIVKPWDTASYLILDNNKAGDRNDYNYGYAGARKGISPVREATFEMHAGCVQYISGDGHNSKFNETYVGDTKVVVRGGINGSSDVGIRLTNVAMLIGDLTLEIHEDNPSIPTQIDWIQASMGTATSTVYGDYYFLMTGGTIGRGISTAKVNAEGNQTVGTDGKTLQWNYTDSNDGYWGAPYATGTIVNEVRGGKLWSFYGSRFANALENTTVSTRLPGVDEDLTANVTVYNKISGGEFGGPVLTGTRTDASGKVIDVQNGTAYKGFFAQVKGTQALASVCNEITGGTFYSFNGANSGSGAGCGDIYNFISGTAEKYPTFLNHFYGTNCTVTTPSVTNVIKGYPVFQNLAGEKLSIFGGCKQGTVTKITNYLGGMPVFDDFYGGASGAAPATGKKDSDCEGVSVDIYNVIALDMTESRISNYIWGGNGYHTIEGVNGAAKTLSNSENLVRGSITCDIYSGHFGTFRAESACGKIDNVPITVNVYDGKWTSDYMPANRNVTRASSSANASVITNNIYGGTFNTCYMGGQNANNREFINNIYGGTFAGYYYGGGGTWVKSVVNNIYAGTFTSYYYGGGGSYSTSTKQYYGTGSESITNNIYGGTFSGNHDYMGSYANPSDLANLCEDQTIENNFYGGDFGKNWVYCGHRNGSVASITNHFYSGEDNPVRDPENELYAYYDAEGVTTKATGTYFRDQVICGSGYSEANVNTNRAGSINNTFEGGGFVTGNGGTNITIRCGMRWGIADEITNNFIKGQYYRVYGGVDFGYVDGTVTNNYGTELEEGEAAPALSFSGYVFGGGYDQTNGPKLLSEKIAEALAADEASRTTTQKAWVAISEEFGEDFEGGAKDIVNNIYYGTFHQFFGGSYGVATSSTQKAVSHIDTITNNVYGGTFERLGSDNYGFTGGCFRNAVIGTIQNNIKGGRFNGNYYGGSIGIGTVDCDAIVNVIDYAEGREDDNSQFYLGNGAPTFNGTITTTINGFKANKTYVYGGSTNIHNQPDGVEYGIQTTINGGEFVGFWGLGGGSSCVYTGNVKTVVNGGTFYGYSSVMPNALIGGPRNGTLIGNVELIINDGEFKADIIGGTLWGSQTAACDTITGNVTTTVNGGSLGNVYALSRYSEEDLKCTGTVTLAGVQTEGKEMKFGGKVSFDTFTANGDVIELTEGANVAIASLTGTLNVKQVEGWAAHDYLKLPEGASYSVDESEVAYGAIEKDDTILVTGVGFDVSGVTIRLEENLGLRFLFDPNCTDAFGDAFRLTVLLGEDTLATATYADLEMYKGYQSFVVKGIGLPDFATAITLKGNAIYDKEFTLIGLVETAKPLFTGEWAEVLGAIENLHKVYNLGETSSIVPEAVTQVNTTTNGAAIEKVSAANVSLAMSDAVALVAEVQLNEIPVNFTMKVNGEAVEDCYKVTAGENTATVAVNLPVKARFMEDMISVELSSDSGVYFTYEFSIAALANDLANQTENENAANAVALLYYIQQAVDCVE